MTGMIPGKYRATARGGNWRQHVEGPRNNGTNRHKLIMWNKIIWKNFLSWITK